MIERIAETLSSTKCSKQMDGWFDEIHKNFKIMLEEVITVREKDDDVTVKQMAAG